MQLLLLVFPLRGSYLWCRAFQNSRSLAQQGAAVLLLSILKQGHLTDPATVAAVCAAAKKLAANEEICKELAEEGAVQTTMQVHTCMLTYECMPQEYQCINRVMEHVSRAVA